VLTKIIEVTQGSEFNWGKFMLGQFDVEWLRHSKLPGNDLAMPLLAQRGWSPRHMVVLDLETGEGAFFTMSHPRWQLDNKHQVWVCPMMGPFLDWLGEQSFETVEDLPDYVTLDTDESAMAGYRRGRLDPAMADVWRGIDKIVEAAVHHGVNSEVATALAHVDRVLRRMYGPTS
jgi:hypothetical protein